MTTPDSYQSNILRFEQERAKGNYVKALEHIDVAIDYCADSYALCTLANLRKETAERVKALEPSAFAKWWTKPRSFKVWGRGKVVA